MFKFDAGPSKINNVFPWGFLDTKEFLSYLKKIFVPVYDEVSFINTIDPGRRPSAIFFPNAFKNN